MHGQNRETLHGTDAAFSARKWPRCPVSSGGYAIGNAPTEMRVKAVATVSMFDLGDARRRAMGTLSYEERMKRLKDAGEQRSREARGEPVRLVPISPDSPAQFTEQTPMLYREGYDY